MKEINCPKCNQHIKILGTDYDLYLENLKKEEQEIERLKADLHEANDSVTWWNNRYNAIVKQNDDNHKKLVKEQEKIEKAIEYIENCHGMYKNTIGDIQPMINIKPVLDILKGVDKE